MLDTIKVGIPLSLRQHSKLLKLVSTGDEWQWVQYQAQTGELRFLRLKGSAELEENSYHRKIYWHLPDHYRVDEAFLTIELSLPKFTYGHNIHLLYSWVDALKDLKKQFEKRLKCRFCDVSQWRVRRVDACYAWRCPSQQTAQDLLDSLKRLRYPRKVPTIRSESISFVGATYSFKFYLKLPEFQVHDMKELIKAKANLDWVNHLEKLATGVLRCEATLRQKYLDKKGIKTVGDLAKLIYLVEWRDDLEIEKYAVIIKQPIDTMFVYATNLDTNEKHCLSTLTYEGVNICDIEPTYLPEIEVNYRITDNLTKTLQYFLSKFIGENRGMDEAGQVETKLTEKYGSAKAIRLLGFWLYIQKLGSEKAKNVYERSVFFRNKADLKAAGISLLDPVKSVELDKQFVESFQFTIPNNHTTNRFDDFKDSGNLLNEKPKDANT